MNRKSLSFLLQKLCLPLGVLVLLVGLGIMVLECAREKEFRLSLLIQEVEHMHLNIKDAASLTENHSMEAVSVKALQISNSLRRIEAKLKPVSVSQQVSTEWNFIKKNWIKLKGVGAKGRLASQANNKSQRQILTISFGELQSHCLRLSADLHTELMQARSQRGVALAVVIVLCLGLIGYGVFFMYTEVLRPLHCLAVSAEALAISNDSFLLGNTHTLVEPVYVKLLQDLENKKYLALAAEQIGEGNFQQDPAALQQGGMLGAAVLQLRQKMEGYFMAEQRRNWSSQGLEQFTILLREQHITTEGLCKSLISEIVPFMNASQGAVFVAEEDERGEVVLQLQAAYAWGRHNFITKTIYAGDGLIGQVVQEQKMLMITDVPEDYIAIGSGLGRAKPRCILMLPLMANEVFQGAIELASFRIFEAHELEFLHKLAESVAAALANLKSTTKTKDLLEKANAANAHRQAREEAFFKNSNTKRLDIRSEVPLFGAISEETEALMTLTRAKIEHTCMCTAFV